MAYFFLAVASLVGLYTYKLITKVMYLFCGMGFLMLRVSSKSRYALRIMVYLAQQGAHAGPARKQDIAEAEEISADYVEQILIRLRGGGLVMSHRGARGGFTLVGEPHLIRVLDVMEAAEGSLAFVPEDEQANSHATITATSRMWLEAQALLETHFADVTIAALAAEADKLRQGAQFMYDI